MKEQKSNVINLNLGDDNKNDSKIENKSKLNKKTKWIGGVSIATFIFGTPTALSSYLGVKYNEVSNEVKDFKAKANLGLKWIIEDLDMVIRGLEKDMTKTDAVERLNTLRKRLINLGDNIGTEWYTTKNKIDNLIKEIIKEK